MIDKAVYSILRFSKMDSVKFIRKVVFLDKLQTYETEPEMPDINS